jgi:hypothetical protein
VSRSNTAPFAIQRPAGIRIRKTASEEKQLAGRIPIDPLNLASPSALSGAAALS